MSKPISTKYQMLIPGDEFALTAGSKVPFYRYISGRKSESLVGGKRDSYFAENTVVFVFPKDGKDIPFTPIDRPATAVATRMVPRQLPAAKVETPPAAPPKPEPPKFLPCRPD